MFRFFLVWGEFGASFDGRFNLGFRESGGDWCSQLYSAADIED